MPVYATNSPSEGTESAAKFSETHVADQTTLGVGHLARKLAASMTPAPARGVTLLLKQGGDISTSVQQGL